MEPGIKLGPYEILKPLGAGGMGEVYRVRDPSLDRDVAIKVLPEALSSDPQRIARFKREARALAALDHPGIVTIYSVEDSAELPFITMQLVEGKTLEELIPEGGLSPDALLELAVPLAEAIDAAHRHGVIHRDIKPANVMVTDDGRLKVLDFGIAKLFEGSSEDTQAATDLTNAGQPIGTVPYMSPEQLLGEPIDVRSDLFSLGVTLYEMATGTRPFDGDTSAAVFDAILHYTPQLDGCQPPGLGRVVGRLLEKDPEARFQSAEELLEALGQLGQFGREARSAPKWVFQKAVAAAALVVFVAVGVGLGWLVREWLGAPSEPTIPRLVNPVQVTSATGVEDYPAWSPDGRTLAYQSNQDGDWDIWIIQPGGGGRSTELQITPVRIDIPAGHLTDSPSRSGPRGTAAAISPWVPWRACLVRSSIPDIRRISDTCP